MKSFLANCVVLNVAGYFPRRSTVTPESPSDEWSRSGAVVRFLFGKLLKNTSAASVSMELLIRLARNLHGWFG